MRAILTAAGLVIVLVAPAHADPCGDLIDRVAAATQATLVNRTIDFADLSAAEGMTMTLACGDPAAVGVQFKGPVLPAGFFPLFGRAGQAATGMDVPVLSEAAQRAQASAVTTRHSHVDADRALVTCSVVTTPGGTVTACAAIDRREGR